ncbi:nam9 protein [Flagelloscypha sp. PMI_526]|nr:nam9 protein [Flagelloscypha sp. PMI_526]
MRSKTAPYHFKQVLPRMSWHPNNVFNMHRRFSPPHAREIDWSSTDKTLFQQRWLARKLVRAYHGDHIKEGQFKKWYLPDTLPDVRPNRANWPAEFGEQGDLKLDRRLIERYAQRDVNDPTWDEDKDGVNGVTDKLEELAHDDGNQQHTKGLAPVSSLMFSEVERRIDVLVFRACFAENVWEARRLVTHGHVKLNGKEHRNSNTRLTPGDMVTVDPDAIRFITEPTGEEAVHQAEHDLYEKVRSSNPNALEPPYRYDHVLNRLPQSFNSSKARLIDSAKLLAPIRRPTKAAKKSPIHQLQTGDVPPLTPFRVPFYSGPNIFVPAYLEVSYLVCSFIYVRHPTARPGYSEIPTPFDADGEVLRSAWDWYSARRPRVSSNRKLSRMPEDRDFRRVEDDKYVRRQLEFNEKVKTVIEGMKRREKEALAKAKTEAVKLGLADQLPEKVRQQREWLKEEKQRVKMRKEERAREEQTI